MSHSIHPSDSSDSSDLVDQINHRSSLSDDRNISSTKQSQFSKSTLNDSSDSSESRSIILKTSCGFLYPVPRSIRSPQVDIYQTGLRHLTLIHFRSAADIAQWFDKFLEHAMLINMHEYFTGRVIFALHDACDAQYHLSLIHI